MSATAAMSAPGAVPAPRPMINLARLDLVSMHLLLECARKGSISEAARHCNLSVMGASERLRRLEDGLGKDLFHRHRYGLELTEAGQAAVRNATAVMLAASQLVMDVQASKVSSPMHAENAGRRGRRSAPRAVIKAQASN